MTALRMLGSAMGGAIISAVMFSAMGTATAPATIKAHFLEDHGNRMDPAYFGDRPIICSGFFANPSPEWPVAGPAPAHPSASAWLEPVAHPGFPTTAVFDTAHLTPQLVILSQPVSMTEIDRERRRWRSFLQRLLD